MIGLALHPYYEQEAFGGNLYESLPDLSLPLFAAVKSTLQSQLDSISDKQIKNKENI